MAARALEQLSKSGLNYRLMPMAEEAYTAADVARWLNLELARVVKAMALESADGRAVAALVSGDRRLDLKAASRAFGEKLKIMPPHKVQQATGYRIGAVTVLGLPPEVEILMDRRILDLDEISLGTGDHKVGLMMHPADLVALLDPILADISK
jgi:Cys-tRNA(Pro)/Cys-tRNA(Cys) deacylase